MAHDMIGKGQQTQAGEGRGNKKPGHGVLKVCGDGGILLVLLQLQQPLFSVRPRRDGSGGGPPAC
ncbi:hypothetical protein ACFSQE_01820 [Vogesella fluminis]|uniref:hypothetical protein n=1 Tax=Vogesella fluminis TaxID=1069161 RepID=UPI003626596B